LVWRKRRTISAEASALFVWSNPTIGILQSILQKHDIFNLAVSAPFRDD
jgi:hypothetical protein